MRDFLVCAGGRLKFARAYHALQVFPDRFQVLWNSGGELENGGNIRKVERGADVSVHPAYFRRNLMFFIRAIEGHGCAFTGRLDVPNSYSVARKREINRGRREMKKQARAERQDNAGF